MGESQPVSGSETFRVILEVVWSEFREFSRELRPFEAFVLEECFCEFMQQTNWTMFLLFLLRITSWREKEEEICRIKREKVKEKHNLEVLEWVRKWKSGVVWFRGRGRSVEQNKTKNQNQRRKKKEENEQQILYPNSKHKTDDPTVESSQDSFLSYFYWIERCIRAFWYARLRDSSTLW